ncbi:unnamed protein product [Meganyctiphanes norvegica]|uniref:BZIP domain-containing protein n=1 Tax=Meganyctiphanes norvegica TaxID=48144 RepID=A0AAV2S9W2_MEGNR
MSDVESLPDISMTQLQYVAMPESTDEIIDTLQLGLPHPSEVILRDDPMMSLNPLNNASFKSSLFELKGSTPVIYEMVHLVPQVYSTSYIKQEQQPTVSYVDLAPVQVSEEDQKTVDQFIDKHVETQTTNIHHITKSINQEEQKPIQNKIKSRKGRKEPIEKVYEKPQILDDPKAERKRQNAIIAKNNRDKQKNRLVELEAQVATLTRERDELKASTQKYRHRSQVFEEQLRKVCNQFGIPVVIVTE